MQLIKKIIQEELAKVISILDETDLYKSIDSVRVNKDPKKNIIYDYEEGKVFAGDNLEVDIAYLDRYHLVDYLPKSESQESWSFEFETVHGTILIVDIERTVKNMISYWSIKFGQLYKDQKTPTLIADILNIPGYDKFIETVNSKFASKLDPSKF